MNETTYNIIITRAIVFLLFWIYIIIRYNIQTPWLMFIPFALLGICLVMKYFKPYMDRVFINADVSRRRKEALKEAAIYLAPYKSIWKDLRLSNKHCSLYLDKDGVSMRATEKVYPYRKFRIVTSTVHKYEDLWNMFCRSFSHNKTYDGLIQDCMRYKVGIYETSEETQKTPSNFDDKTLQQNIKLDINNCSEVEMTALPGISIVMSKKVIRKREEIGGFKSVEDFFLFLKIKPHIEKQLRDKICVKKMVKTKKVELNQERKIDL